MPVRHFQYLLASDERVCEVTREVVVMDLSCRTNLAHFGLCLGCKSTHGKDRKDVNSSTWFKGVLGGDPGSWNILFQERRSSKTQKVSCGRRVVSTPAKRR